MGERSDKCALLSSLLKQHYVSELKGLKAEGGPDSEIPDSVRLHE